MIGDSKGLIVRELPLCVGTALSITAFVSSSINSGTPFPKET
jgi:hypothetical protein